MPRVQLPITLGANRGLPRIFGSIQFAGSGFAPTTFLVDSGTEHTLVSHAAWSRLRRKPRVAREPKTILGIGGPAHFLKASGAQLILRSGSKSHLLDIGTVFLNDDEKLKLSCLGADFLRRWNAVIHVDYGTPALSYIEIDQPTLTIATPAPPPDFHS